MNMNKIPDKIYMPNELLSGEWQRHIEGEDTVYIRKDVLLEWAENNRDSAGKLSFTEFIDKIESL